MERWVGKVAIVTGASSGTGETTCRLLVKQGMIVVGFARREDRLQKLKEELGENFYFVKVDLCSEENILEAFSWVKSTLKSVDVLVNNAAVLQYSNLLGETADWKLMYDTNILAVNICSREAIKIMRELEIQGHIININSVVGHQIIAGLTNTSIYCITKYCITSISEYLRSLMCSLNLPIRVTNISPGLTETEMAEGFNVKNLDDNLKLQPIDVAGSIVFALGAPQRANVSEIIIRPTAEHLESIVELKFQKNS